MSVVSIEAETALRRLGALRGFHRQTQRALSTTGSVRMQQVGRSTSSGQMRTLNEACLVRCVSIIEAYATDLADATVDARLQGMHSAEAVPTASKEMVAYLLAEKRATLSSGVWERLVAFWARGIGVPFRDFHGHDELALMRSARHAIAHRVGEYTRRYRNDARERLDELGINPVQASGLIPLDADDIVDALELARAFVLWLDERASLVVREPMR